MNTNQIEMVSIDGLVPATHPYKKLKGLMDFDRIVKSVKVDISDLYQFQFKTWSDKLLSKRTQCSKWAALAEAQAVYDFKWDWY